MSTLFDTDNRSAGWHLSSLEIYNWGTFHERIYRLAPQGRNSLLTGSNGSGKTTVVDALVTLLVPPGKRHYNQSSGADRKKERDEISYFLGAYGNLRDDDSTTGSTQYLRGKDGCSVLAAVFTNGSFQQQATLAQIRWWSAGTFKRLYILSSDALDLEKDLLPFDGGTAWKKALASHHPVKFFDTFALYAQAFSALFGFRSDKALSLFSHVVGVKVLGDLNEFIRENMLDLADMEDDFVHLRKNYDDLLGAHQQIEKAREQLRLLDPVIERGQVWEQAGRRKLSLDRAFENVAPVFAAQQAALLKDASGREEARLIAADSRRGDLEAELDLLRRKERDLEFSLREDRTADVLQALEREEAHRRPQLEAKTRLWEEYVALATPLGLPLPTDQEQFWSAREEAGRQKTRLEEHLPLLSNTWADLRQKLRHWEDERQQLEAERQSLAEREGQIPRPLASLRAQLVQALDLPAHEFPFFGELMRGRDARWIPALEALLRPLALSLAVPERHEARVRAWLSEAQPASGLRLFILKEEPEGHFFTSAESGLIDELIETRKSAAGTVAAQAAEILRQHLKNHWDFRACEQLEELNHCRRGIHLSGWTRDHRLWEKPAAGWDDPAHFVLGWENTDKERLLALRIEDIRRQEETLQVELRATEERRDGLDNRRIGFEKLLEFRNWSELDRQTETRELEDLARRRQEFSSGSVDAAQIQERLAEIRLKIRDRNKEKDEATAFIGRVRKTLEEYQDEEARVRKVLAENPDLDYEAARTELEPWLKQTHVLLDLANLETVRDGVLKTISSERKQQADAFKLLERDLETAMHQFINPGAQLAQRFPEWTGETSVLMAKTDYLPEFRRWHDRIRQEDLPGHQKRFKDWLNQRLVEDIADFKTSLENHQRAILESVRELNASLKTITYNTFPATYIQLHTEDSRDLQIREFRKMLREALQSDGTRQDADLEEIFHRIRKIIQALTEDEPWRRKVTDVRNWLQFAAVERFSEDGAQRQYYQDSQSLSGGEKAKLAYTILASAIAHQFGISRDGVASRSFRFAVVDEAFSKVDPENSKFAMNLFEQLNLQLMVVTPLDKINVVEDYIHTIHYVENKQRRTSSVYDLAIEEYRA